MKIAKQVKADLVLVLITVLWGGSFPISSISLKYMGPFTFLFFRYLLAAFILVLICMKRLKNTNITILKAAFYIGMSIMLGCAFQFWGLSYTTPSKNGFITGINVVLVPIILALLYKKIPELKVILGVILALIGLAIMSLTGGITNINKGDILTLICAVFFAVQIVLVDKLAVDIDIMLLTCLEMVVVMVTSFVPAYIVEGFNFKPVPFLIFSLIYLSVFCTVFAYGMQNKVQPYTTPTHAAIIFTLEPVFAALFSTLIGDSLTGRTLIGSVFILVGTLLITLKSSKVETEQSIKVS